MKPKSGFSAIALTLPFLVIAVFIGAIVFLSSKGVRNTPMVSSPPRLDPSYLTIHTNPEVTPRVFSPYNEEIVGHNDIENPLAAQEDSVEICGEALNVFSFPKPPYGKYRVNFEGVGEYNADITIIGKDGSIFSDIITGETTEEQPGEVFIYIGEENRISDE